MSELKNIKIAQQERRKEAHAPLLLWFTKMSLIIAALSLIGAVAFIVASSAQSLGHPLVAEAKIFEELTEEILAQDGLHDLLQEYDFEGAFEEEYEKLAKEYKKQFEIIDYDTYTSDRVYLDIADFAHKYDSGKIAALHAKAVKYNQGEVIEFESLDAASEFINYYLQNETLENPNSLGAEQIGQLFAYEKVNGVIRMKKYAVVDDPSIARRILYSYRVKQQESDYLTVKAACKEVRDNMWYRDSYVETEMLDALEDQCGVCVHYAKTAYVLLNNLGIPTRCCCGVNHEGENHAWNECLIEGEWIQVDFTPSSNSEEGFPERQYTEKSMIELLS